MLPVQAYLEISLNARKMYSRGRENTSNMGRN